MLCSMDSTLRAVPWQVDVMLPNVKVVNFWSMSIEVISLLLIWVLADLAFNLFVLQISNSTTCFSAFLTAHRSLKEEICQKA